MNYKILIASLLALVTSACEPQVAGLGSFLGQKAEPGSCLLAYNTAFVEGTGEDACCFYDGESNNCDPERPCNQLAGNECCVLYSTVDSTIGHACCLYSDGGKPSGWSGEDITDECHALIYSP